MKGLFIILLILIVACTNNQDFDKSQEYYFDGLEKLTILDSQGNLSYELAKESFDKALELYPNHYEAAYWKAYCELNSEKFNEAIKTSKQYLKTINENHLNKPDLFVVKGIAELNIGEINQSNIDFDNAKQIYEKRINKDSSDKNSILNYALILCYQNKKPDAISFLESHKRKVKSEESINEIIEAINEFDIQVIKK